MRKAIYRKIEKFVDPRITPTLDPRLENMGFRENRFLQPIQQPAPGDERFWIWEFDYIFAGAGMKWENPYEGYAWGRGMGLPDFSETPRFRFGLPKSAYETKPFCEFWDYRGIFIASEKFVNAVSKLDAEGIEVINTDFRFSCGDTPDLPYYMVDVIRRYPATDLANSVLLYTRTDLKWPPYLVRTPKIKLFPDIPRSFHVFREAWSVSGRPLFFSDNLVVKLCRANIVGMAFRDPAMDYATKHSK
jgi:hypothetical protein